MTVKLADSVTSADMPSAVRSGFVRYLHVKRKGTEAAELQGDVLFISSGAAVMKGVKQLSLVFQYVKNN